MVSLVEVEDDFLMTSGHLLYASTTIRYIYMTSEWAIIVNVNELPRPGRVLPRMGAVFVRLTPIYLTRFTRLDQSFDIFINFGPPNIIPGKILCLINAHMLTMEHLQYFVLQFNGDNDSVGFELCWLCWSLRVSSTISSLDRISQKIYFLQDSTKIMVNMGLIVIVLKSE